MIYFIYFKKKNLVSFRELEYLVKRQKYKTLTAYTLLHVY